jgi:hypothetical protein
MSSLLCGIWARLLQVLWIGKVRMNSKEKGQHLFSTDGHHRGSWECWEWGLQGLIQPNCRGYSFSKLVSLAETYFMHTCMQCFESPYVLSHEQYMIVCRRRSALKSALCSLHTPHEGQVQKPLMCTLYNQVTEMIFLVEDYFHVGWRFAFSVIRCCTTVCHDCAIGGGLLGTKKKTITRYLEDVSYKL